ncbi:uncharacterized protein LOC110738373 isoform X2 [Chenopodium quinoa]|uniref:uncharacterized protein LOC110738373 isoform X2 n=1 Tax=Chenopodium quinoa TaxID=63459 RepID=UPI000B7748A1|nr:uncharacterized protein LOC110738373 isoform X2 [Chenopodium quinoa]
MGRTWVRVLSLKFLIAPSTPVFSVFSTFLKLLPNSIITHSSNLNSISTFPTMASSKSSTLKLLMQQGPRQGETLEFNSKVRIGRVVKGNNLTIKDPGISSKHLIIEFNKESGIWEIKDLDSSNGTILNSSQLKPLSPFEIRNGDEIKFGELTSIRVEIVPIEEETNNSRITRKRKAAIDLGSIKGSKLEIGDLKVDAKKEDEHDCGVMSKRNTRSSKRGEVEFLGLEQVMLPKRTRRAKNADGVIPPFSVVEELVEDKGFDMGDCKHTRGGGGGGRGCGRGRGRIKKHSIRSLDDVPDAFPEALEKEVPCENWMDDNTKLELSEQEGGAPSLKGENAADTQQENGQCGVESDATLDDRRMEAAQDVVLEEKVNHEVLGKELPEQAVNSRHQPCEKQMDDKTNAQFSEGVVLDQDGGDQCVGEQHCAEEADGNLDGGSQAEERVCNGVESDVVLNDGGVEESDIEEIVKESEVKCYDRSKDLEAINVPDLEKMTLAEWFDYLEVYLPNQIYAATDEIIKDMQKRAKQFDEFML